MPVRDGAAAPAALRAAGIVVSGRGDLLRLSFHLYNAPDEAAAAARLPRQHVISREES